MHFTSLISTLFFCYIITILVETPVLIIGLSARHKLKDKLFAGVWLTACTYPIVVMVIPFFFDPLSARTTYLMIAETFAPLAECALFWAAYGLRSEWGKPSMWRDFAAVTLANLASFGLGEALQWLRWM